MKDIVPNFSNVQSLQDLSKVLLLPMAIASYLMQTGFYIHSHHIWIDVSAHPTLIVKIISAIVILSLKSSVVCAAVAFVYGAVMLMHHRILDQWVMVVSTGFMAIGLYGVVGGEQVAASMELNRLWFYTFVVFAFFLRSAIEDIHPNRNKPTAIQPPIQPSARPKAHELKYRRETPYYQDQ